MLSDAKQASTPAKTLQADLCQQRCIHPEHVLAVRRHLLPVEQVADLATLFAVLSDPTRLQVLTDVFALGLAWFATAQAERPATPPRRLATTASASWRPWSMPSP